MIELLLVDSFIIRTVEPEMLVVGDAPLLMVSVPEIELQNYHCVNVSIW